MMLIKATPKTFKYGFGGFLVIFATLGLMGFAAPLCITASASFVIMSALLGGEFFTYP